MATVNVKIPTPGQRAKASLAHKTKSIPGIRVEPADDPSGDKRWTADDMRKLLKHPRAGGFRSEGSIEWPLDTFTARRIREGAVKAVADKAKASPHHAATTHHHSS